MNAESAWRRSRKTSGRRHLKDSATDLTEWAASLDLLPRLRATSTSSTSWTPTRSTCPRTRALGLLEDLEAAV